FTEGDRRHHDVERQLASVILVRQPLEAMTALGQREFCHLLGLFNGQLAVGLALGPDLRWRNVTEGFPARRSDPPHKCFVRLDKSARPCGSKSDMASALRSNSERKRASLSSSAASASFRSVMSRDTSTNTGLPSRSIAVAFTSSGTSVPSNRRAVHSNLLLPLFNVSAMRRATDSTVGEPSGCTWGESSSARLPTSSALLLRISTAAASLQSTIAAVPGSNNQTAS